MSKFHFLLLKIAIMWNLVFHYILYKNAIFLLLITLLRAFPSHVWPLYPLGQKNNYFVSHTYLRGKIGGIFFRDISYAW